MSKTQNAPTPVAVRHDLAATSFERRESGRQARVLAPRAGLGEWDEKARGHEPIDTLMAQNDLRLAEVVNVPNALVTCRLPLDVFEDS